MGEINFADDVQSEKFQKSVAEVLDYLQKKKVAHHYKTICTLINDNIKLFERVKELENGSTEPTKNS